MNQPGPPRLVPAGHLPARPSSVLSGGSVLKQKPGPLCTAQKHCYNLIRTKTLLFAGNSDPTLRLRVQ